ncbi:GH92 family glycosyl hydrolase [Mucilaginibacter aquaedulcis]|uniref:GH92 family glycosyl hydrolase n=1 Tax=Mucilaginibacter aquaedulcis TaxID=1187081 RepID=UPI0025B582D1|nr:GH92 family glycosyl hydrolase [Mucilaginibacter aquaedulcis]MDN3546775.1 GH92 family glycosyl hydrolase [Mucilaginibacter aquaedulcis]
MPFIKFELRSILTITFLIIAVATASAQKAQKTEKKKEKDYAQLVDPFIGTGGHGHTYPGAVVPFGMVQLSPDTRLSGWDGSSGYHYSDTVVYGFSHTHLSGTGDPDYCDILFMPTTGEPQFKNTDYRSVFKKKNELAIPGYYKTLLDKYNISVELTATARVGVHRYTYPSTAEKANIIIDLQHRDEVTNAWIEVVNDHEIRGFRESSSWAQDQQVYFYAKFSKPFKSYGIASNDQLLDGKNKAEGKNIKMYLQFDNPGEVVSKVGISAVSAEGALKNLDAEVSDFDFKRIQKAAKAAWNTELNKIQVEGGAPTVASATQNAQADLQESGGAKGRVPKDRRPVVPDYSKIKQTIFYTALYHTMLAPSIYSDVDGQYRGLDQQIHTAQGFNYYTVFSLWDTYRAEHPLLTLIDKKRTLDFIKTFLAMYEQGGMLPMWPLASNETFAMVGNHAIPVIVDAYSKGIRDFDAAEAFKAMKASVNRNQFELDNYRKTGAVQADTADRSVSKTLEYAYDDWCIAQMAKMLDKQQDYVDYIQRAQYWKNVYNNQNGFMQARINGDWYSPFDPTEINRHYAEGNAWQYTFLVPQDVDGLIKHMGSTQNFENKLDELFTTSSKLSGSAVPDVAGLIGQYAHGNEPSHHIAYLYNFTDSPDKTQFYIDRILREEYSEKPNGLAGNEDCGQMSAWYVMSSLGIYNIAPGQTEFLVGIPQFDKAVIYLENGKKFTIINSGAGMSRNNIYLQGMSLAKKAYNKLYLNYTDIADGGEFEVFTGRLSNKLFLQDLEKPVSQIADNLIVANPYITGPSKNFKLPATVQIKSADADAKIYYTLDGSSPTANSTLYNQPITISVSTTIRAVAIMNGKSSFVDEAKFVKQN